MPNTNGQEVKKPRYDDVWTGKMSLEDAIAFDKAHNGGMGLRPGTILMAESDYAEFAEYKRTIPGFVILVTKPGINAYHGLVEGSFSLGPSEDRTQFHWSGTGRSNFGTRHTVDGKKCAEEMVDHFKKHHPEWEFEIFDARDADALPVVLDWDRWIMACRPAATLAGVSDKYGARNLRFAMKE